VLVVGCNLTDSLLSQIKVELIISPDPAEYIWKGKEKQLPEPGPAATAAAERLFD